LIKHVLITGGTGFLGSYIIKHLVQGGYTVRAIRRSNTLPTWIDTAILNKVEWVDGDVLDVVSLENAMLNIDTVIHSAAVVSFTKKHHDQMMHTNVEGTANVVNIALEKNIRRLVHISSVAALGRTASGGIVTEEKKWEESKMNTQYARSKFKAELHVWRAIGEGLNAVILNPSTILGYGDWKSGSSSIFRNVYNGFKWYTNGINGFVDVEDVAVATLLIMESGISEQRFIVNGETWTFRKLQESIAGAFQKTPPSREATALILSFAVKAEYLKSLLTGRSPLLTTESARIGMSKTYFQNDKILAALPGFSFTPLVETIKKTCEKYLGTIHEMQP
jgi:nucleoside-diphosphate-sugar epimerase